MGKVLTLDKQKNGFPLANRSFSYQAKEETFDHLILHSKRTQLLWGFLFVLFGIRWVISASIKDALITWHYRVIRKRQRMG